jgi:hypothetical protein
MNSHSTFVRPLNLLICVTELLVVATNITELKVNVKIVDINSITFRIFLLLIGVFFLIHYSILDFFFTLFSIYFNSPVVFMFFFKV